MKRELYEYAISYRNRWVDDKMFQKDKRALTNFTLGLFILIHAICIACAYFLQWRYGSILLTVLYVLSLLRLFTEKDVYAKRLLFTFISLIFLLIPSLLMLSSFLHFRWWAFFAIVLASILSYEAVFLIRMESKKYSIGNAFPKKHRKWLIPGSAGYLLGLSLRQVFQDEPRYYYLLIPVMVAATAYSIAFGQRYLVYKILSIPDRETSGTEEKKLTLKGSGQK